MSVVNFMNVSSNFAWTCLAYACIDASFRHLTFDGSFFGAKFEYPSACICPWK